MRHVLGVALMVAIAAAAGCESRQRATELRAEDVAWAASWNIWKIDLANAGPVYGIQVVVVNKDGNVVNSSGCVGGDRVIDLSIGSVATVAIHLDGQSVQGRLRLHGSTSNFEFANVFKPGGWGTVGDPERNGDRYFLIADSRSVRSGKAPFDEDSTKIALEILRAPLKR